jgi:Ca2+-binding EF-hand superfamily protein
MKTRLLAAAAALALIPLAGMAGEGDKTSPGPAGATFDTLDANKDGRISMPEASADPDLVEAFSVADKNGDGYLDSAEFSASARKPQR